MATDEIQNVFKSTKPKASPTISEYEREQLALYAKRDRLRAERLAREAAHQKQIAS
jgi:hypothetical protein